MPHPLAPEVLQSIEGDLVVVGDPHGDLASFQELFSRLQTPGRTFACVGDVIGKSSGAQGSALSTWMSEQEIFTVQGNHEEWSVPRGEVFVWNPDLLQEESSDSSRKLTSRALRWLQSLPKNIEFRSHSGPRARMTHSLREPRWRDLSKENLDAFLAQEAEPDLAFVGHSHRPRFLIQSRQEVEEIPFDFVSTSELSLCLPERAKVVVDVGSLGIPKHPESGVSFPQWGTYAIWDPQARSVKLRRVEAPN